MDFECRYIRMHTKEKSSNISYIIFLILPSKKILKLIGHPEYFGIYYSTLKWFILA